jgi:hypothetical protein
MQAPAGRPAADGGLPSAAPGSKESVRKKQVMLLREQTKHLVSAIEERLPDSCKSGPSRNGAGKRRSLGGSGRTMNDVLQDVIAFVAARKDKPEVRPAVSVSPPAVKTEEDASFASSTTASSTSTPGACSPCPRAASHPPSVGSGAVCVDIVRSGLFSAHGLLCLEVEMGGEQDWLICAVGRGAARRWTAASWLGEGVGHSFSQLVHRHDYATLLALGDQCVAHQPWPIDVRVVTFDKVLLGDSEKVVCVCARARVCVRVCVRTCVRARVRACARACCASFTTRQRSVRAP